MLKGKDKKEPYVKIDYDMINSVAWKSLSAGAVWCYIELKKSFNLEKGGNSHLLLPYSTIEWMMAPATISKNITELIRHGFVDIVEHGGLMRKPNIYRLSERWREQSLKKEA